MTLCQSTVRDHASADAFLALGKNKNDRPLANNTRLRRLQDGSIAVHYHNTDVVTYHADGLTTIWFGGWDTVTTHSRVRAFAPTVHVTRVERRRYMVDGVDLELPGGSLAILEPGHAVTDERVQKCRKCHGDGTMPVPCLEVRAYRYSWGPLGVHGPDYCHEHGTPALHSHPVKCYWCDGVGRRDYGSHAVPTPFDDDDRVTVDASGAIVDSPPFSHAVSPTSVAPKSGWYDSPVYGGPSPKTTDSDVVSGSTVTSSLRELLPGFRESVFCPACPHAPAREIPSLIMHLNDDHRWTREAIADHLETLDVDLRFPTSA